MWSEVATPGKIQAEINLHTPSMTLHNSLILLPEGLEAIQTLCMNLWSLVYGALFPECTPFLDATEVCLPSSHKHLPIEISFWWNTPPLLPGISCSPHIRDTLPDTPIHPPTYQTAYKTTWQDNGIDWMESLKWFLVDFHKCSAAMCVWQVCSRAKFGTYWKPFSTNTGIFWHANFGIEPKLAETAPCSVGRLMSHFCRKWNKSQNW